MRAERSRRYQFSLKLFVNMLVYTSLSTDQCKNACARITHGAPWETLRNHTLLQTSACKTHVGSTCIGPFSYKWEQGYQTNCIELIWSHTLKLALIRHYDLIGCSVKRKASTKTNLKLSVGKFQQINACFLQQTVCLVKAHAIPPELIIYQHEASSSRGLDHGKENKNLSSEITYY